MAYACTPFLRNMVPALLALWQLAVCAPARADERALDLASAETITLSGDLRIVSADGEQSWVDDEFGKLRYGGSVDGSIRVRPELGHAAVAWQPRLTWSLSATVVAAVQGGERIEAGLSEAYLTFKPLAEGKVKVSARAGLMYPPISLEHGGADWSTTDTITPSAINTWVSEEVKVTGVEASVRAQVGEHVLTASGAIFDMNETAGALVALRGWAMHDRLGLAFHAQPVPRLNTFMSFVQPRFTHPVIAIDHGFMSRPGYYAKLAWDLPSAIHIEALHYDNKGTPDDVNADLEWGWRTRFDNIGLVADLAPGWRLKAQALAGRTAMGDDIAEVYWVETRFRAAYALLTRTFNSGSVSLRGDLFGTRDSGSALLADDDEDGWALTFAARRRLATNFTAVGEFLHIESTRQARLRSGLSPRQEQNQLQLALRVNW